MSPSPVERIRQFYADWCLLSPGELARYFTPDAIFQPVSRDRPIVSAGAIAGTIEIFRARFEAVEVDILHMAAADPGVHCEHLWHFTAAGGRTLSVPANDVFSFAGEKICSWRSYFNPQALIGRIDLGEG